MHLVSERSVMTMAFIARQSSGFVAVPTVLPIQRTGGCQARDVKPRMFGGAPTVRLNLATLDADTAERTAERLWGLGEAEEREAVESIDEELAKFPEMSHILVIVEDDEGVEPSRSSPLPLTHEPYCASSCTEVGLGLGGAHKGYMTEAKDQCVEDDFMADAECSALRRYEYSKMTDTDDADDNNEYYI